MKTRIDYVSNSSSCSFVVACKSQYLDIVAKDLAKSCTDKKYQWHDKNLAARNKRILDFCLNTFQLAYLGSLVVDVKKEKYSLQKFKKWYKSGNFAEKEWNKYKDLISRLKNDEKTCTAWEKREYGLDEYDQATDTVVHVNKICVQDVVVSNDVMTYELDRFVLNENHEDIAITRRRAKKLIDLAKSNCNENHRIDRYGNVDIYQVTKNTIANTRDLISCGYYVELDDWAKDLDALERRIDNGDAIFYVRIAHDGDGYGDFYIYCESTADGLDGVSGIEILYSDSL